jgi:Tfp pilus assembly PilM family ATPase
MSEKTPNRWKSPGPAAARRFVAVDFDSRQVRLVQAERSGSGARILRIAGRAAPEGLDLADAKAIGELLRAALKENRLAGWPVIMCVPRGLAVLKTLLFPPATQDSELAGMVQYQVEKELPFRPEEAVVDFTTESHYHAGGPAEEAGGTRVLVAAVRVPVVDYYRQIALSAGVKLLRLGLRPYANQRCFAATMPGGSTEKCAVVHVTADETEIDVVVGDSLAFSRSSLGKVPDAAKATGAELAEAAAAVVTEIIRSLQSYQSVEGGGKVDKVYLAGGTGIEALVAKELAQRQGARCQMFNPAEAMKLGARANGGTAAEFISALGLAAGCGAVPLDFLHPKRPVAPRNVRRTQAILATVVAVVLLAAGVTARGNYIGVKQARRDSLLSDYHKLDAKRKGLDANNARVASIEAWEKKGQNWLDHFALLSAEFPSAKDAYTGAITSNEDGSLNFTVHAASEQTITEIAKRLDQVGYEVVAGRQRKNNDPKYPHTAEMKVRPGPNMMVDLESLEAVPRPEDDMAPGEVVPRVRVAQAAPSNPNAAANAGNQGGGGNPGARGNPNPGANVNLNPSPTAGPRDPNRRFGAGGRRGGGP